MTVRSGSGSPEFERVREELIALRTSLARGRDTSGIDTVRIAEELSAVQAHLRRLQQQLERRKEPGRAARP